MRSPTYLQESRVYSQKKFRSRVQKDFCNFPPDLSPVSIRLALLFLLLTRGGWGKVLPESAEPPKDSHLTADAEARAPGDEEGF
jgi:hypothetical protein